jgi:hypothetical protein
MAMPASGNKGTAEAEFRASYDRVAKILSGFFCLLVLAMAIALRNVFTTALLALVVGLAYAWSPRGYCVSRDSITVKRLIGDVRVPLERVRELRRATPDDWRGSLRLWGSGGLFGYYGLHRTSRLGRCTWYMTNCKNAVVLVTEEKTTIYSPDDVDGFFAAARPAGSIQIPKRGGSSAAVAEGDAPATGGAPSTRMRVAVTAAVTLAIIGLIIGLFAIRYSPGPPTYTLSHEALEIHDAFYPVTLKTESVDVDRIQIVDLNRETDWRPVVRTSGFSNSHYHSGWFRAQNGTKVRLYSAEGRRLVLLPRIGDEAPVLLEAENPDRFVQDIASEWGHRK